MASLFNTRISDTYSGLIKTIDNAALTASLKELTDGSGLSTGVYMNNAGDFKVTAILEFGSLKDTGENIIISKFVDAGDGIANNDNDTTIPTTAAIIDYVAAQITIEDLDFTGDTGSGQIDLDSQIFAIGGTTNEITTVASGQSLTLSLDSTGVNLPDNSTAITQTAGDNSTKIATTSYVDTLDAASDLDFSGDSGTGDVNLNTQTFAITGTTNQIESSASNQGLSLQFPSAGVTLPDGSIATTQSAGDNSTKVATTSYVDTLDAASDLDITDGTNTGDVNLNTQSLSILGTTNEIDSVVSGQSVTLGLPNQINVNVQGNLTGDVTGDVTGDLTGNSAGTHTGAVIGNVTGNVIGDVTGDLTGNADTATAWETARDLSLTGQATGTISSVDGTNNVSGAVTLDNNSVTGKVLTGLTSPSASSVLATDTIVEGIGKLQSQVNGLAGGLRFIGSWDADTNSPVLSDGGGEAANGTTTSTTANKLVDSSASFTTTVTVGDQVVNQVDGQTALVSNIDSDTTLSLDNDIMLTGEAYTIDNSPFITQGHYYVVSVGGTTSLNGVSNWTIGDWVIAGANNQWTKLDHSQVDGTGTTGNLTKWSSTSVIADSIVSESGSAITVDGSLSTNTNLSSTGDFAVNTDKFTVAAASGNTAFTGDLAINTNKFTVNATSGNTLVAGTLNVTGKSTFGNDITISDSTPILDFEDTDNTDNNYRFEAKGSFGGFFFQSFDNGFNNGNTLLFAKYSDGFIGLGGNTNPQAQLDITGGLITSGDATFAGNVGIGTDDPDAKLEITTLRENGIRLSSSDSTAFPDELLSGIEFYSPDTSGGAGVKASIQVKYNDGDANSYMTFATGTNTERMRIDSSGQVKITSTGSTSNNDTAIKFDINSTNHIKQRITTSSTGGYQATLELESDGNAVSIATSGSNEIRFNTSSSEAMRIDSSGNVGINTGSNTPDALLTLEASSHNQAFAGKRDATNYLWFLRNENNSGRFQLYNSSSSQTIEFTGADGGATFAGNVTLEQNSASPVLLVKASGQTSSTAPYSKLVLAAGSASGVDVGSNIMGYRTADFSSAAARSTGLKFGVLQNNVAKDAMWINEAGNVGINETDPDVKLHVNGGTSNVSLLLESTDNKSYISFKDNDTTSTPLVGGDDNDLSFVTSDTERMRITSGGDVRINSDSSAASGTKSLQFYRASAERGALRFDFSNSTTSLQADGEITFLTAGENERMRIDSSGHTSILGRLGVGDAGAGASSQQLKVRGDSNSSDIMMQIDNTKYGSTDSSGESKIVFGWDNHSAANIAAYKDGSVNRTGFKFVTEVGYNVPVEVMRITSGGNINIGTSTNFHQFEPEADMDFNFILNAGQVNASPNYTIKSSTSGGAITSRLQLIGSTGNMTITGSLTQNGSISDISLKENIKPVENALDKIEKLNAVSFDWKKSDSILQLKEDYGFIAQEVEEVIPEIVRTNTDDKKVINYNGITSVLVKAIQELKAEVDLLKKECKCKN